MQRLEVSSQKREELINITSQVQDVLNVNEWQYGVIFIYCPHTSAGITINEAADPTVTSDFVVNLRRLIPQRGDYKHLEGNSDAHIKSSLVGCSELVLVEDGRLVLGTWQGIFFAEFDGPRNRKVYLRWLRG